MSSTKLGQVHRQEQWGGRGTVHEAGAKARAPHGIKRISSVKCFDLGYVRQL